MKSLKLPRKLKKRLKRQIVKGTEWQTEECKITNFGLRWDGKVRVSYQLLQSGKVHNK